MRHSVCVFLAVYYNCLLDMRRHSELSARVEYIMRSANWSKRELSLIANVGVGSASAHWDILHEIRRWELVWCG